MTTIDPIRRAAEMRRAAAARRAAAGRVEKASDVSKPGDRMLPVPYQAPSLPSLAEDQVEAAAAFSAQLIGQAAKRRGREPVDVLSTARTVYVTTEWSGPADRRARKGMVTQTQV